jgi:serine/threonine protein kinase
VISPQCPSDEELRAYQREPYLDPLGIADHLDACPDCEERALSLEPAPHSPELSTTTEPPSDLVRQAKNVGDLDQPITEDLERLIPGYKIVGPVGRGGNGVVYLARHPRFQLVALKVLDKNALATLEEVAQARREIQESQLAWNQAVASGLPNPPFVRVYEAGETSDGTFFISMEYIPNGTLGDRLKDLVRSPGIGAEYLRNIAQAIHERHIQGVVHRDLKLSNILLRLKPGRRYPEQPKTAPLEDLEPIVSDWGLAKQFDSLENSSQFLLKGTLEYIAPELIRKGTTYARPSSDVFALGVIFYRLLTGEKPFEADSIQGLLNAIVNDDPRRPCSLKRGLDRDLEAICLKCLEKDPARRYASAAGLASDLGRYLAQDRADPVKARLPGTVRKVGLWCRKNPWAATLFGVATLTAASGFWAYSKDREAALARANAAIQDAQLAEARERSARLAGEARKSRELALESRISQTILAYSVSGTDIEPNAIAAPPEAALETIANLIIQAPNLDEANRKAARELKTFFTPAAAKERESLDNKQLKKLRDQARSQIPLLLKSVEELAREFPQNSGYRFLMAAKNLAIGKQEFDRQNGLQLTMALIASSLGRPVSLPKMEAALSRYDQALADLDLIQGGSINPGLIRNCRRDGYYGRAAAFLSLSRYSEALISFDRGLELSDPDQAKGFAGTRLICRMAAEIEQSKMPWSRGSKVDHAKAVRLADYLAGTPDVSLAAVYNAACAFALASLDDKADAPERERRALRAVALLSRISEAHYFDGSKRADELLNDPDLKPLRDRADFQALVARAVPKK